FLLESHPDASIEVLELRSVVGQIKGVLPHRLVLGVFVEDVTGGSVVAGVEAGVGVVSEGGLGTAERRIGLEVFPKPPGEREEAGSGHARAIDTLRHPQRELALARV